MEMHTKMSAFSLQGKREVGRPRRIVSDEVSFRMTLIMMWMLCWKRVFEHPKQGD